MPDLPEDSDGKWELVACPEQGSEWRDSPGFTLRERESGQLMHSRIGPWTEANTVYVGQSGAVPGPESGSGGAVLYDIGMGIASNALAAISAWKGEGQLRIFSFERHPEALLAALAHPESFPVHDSRREALRALLEKGEWRAPRVEWKLLACDFREARLDAWPEADLAYFDFYAPAACPELWSTEVFLKLRAKMRENGLLITYASSKAVRAALLLAGFFVGEGRATSLKNATTLASPSRDRLRAPLDGAWIASLARSTKPLPEGWRNLASHPQFSL